jgi:sulfate permease, SulP family
MIATFDTIRLLPFLKEFHQYKWDYFRNDLFAALSVALLALPQAMAYAFVAELPPAVGIFSAIFGTIFTAAFGSSRYLISGPSNTIAILLQVGIAEILYTYYRGVSGAERDYLAMHIALQITVVVGIFQILAGLLKLGKVIQFASKSVVMGYTFGAALAIMITQVFPFLGIGEMAGFHPLYQQLWYFLSTIQQIHLSTAIIGISCLLLLIVLQRSWPKIPGAIIVFVLASFAVYFLGWANESSRSVVLLEDFGPIYSDLPSLSSPFFDLRIMNKILPLAFAIMLLGVLEATAIGKSLVGVHDASYSVNQEIFGLGVSNFASSFFGAMPSSGSFSRSALNYYCGAKTRFAAILSGVVLFIIVMALGFLVTKIPLTALSALMLYTAYTMVNFKHLYLCLKATKTDALVVLVTVISSLLFSLDVALYVGVVLSVVFYLKQSSTPYLIEYTFNKIGKLRAMETDDERLDQRIRIIHIEGELFFGAADLFQTTIRKVLEDEDIQVIILQIKNARHFDATACLALEQLYEYLKRTNRYLLASGVTPEVWKVLDDSGLIEEIGKEHFFLVNDQLPSESTRNAYAYAKTLLIE